MATDIQRFAGNDRFLPRQLKGAHAEIVHRVQDYNLKRIIKGAGSAKADGVAG